MKKEAKDWLEIAKQDYEFGMYGYERGFYPQAVYMLCQSLEKVLKAAQIEFADEFPQKTHQLKMLAKKSTLEFTDKQYEALEDLSIHYGKVRYPDYMKNQYNTKNKVAKIISQAKDLYLWILPQFKNH